MQDRVFIKAPAKLNLFLRIMGQQSNGFHIIRTGITFLDLHDEVKISLSDINNITYSGPFKPFSSIYENDIIVKVLKNISSIKKLKLQIKITKNIPWQAGLGSASTDAAALIRGLVKLNLINSIDNQFLSKIGTDVVACYYGQDCLVTGIGDRINIDIDFPKYYFILVFPRIRLSTPTMYSKIKEYLKFDKDHITKIAYLKTLHKNDNFNDFEKIVRNENQHILNLLDFLSSLENSIFSRMSGSGSCCYVVFENKESAKKALNLVSTKYSDYWICLAENNSNKIN